MNRRLPSWMSLGLLLVVLVVGILLYLRPEEPAPPEPSSAPPTEGQAQPPTTTPQTTPKRHDTPTNKEGQVGPGALRLHFPAYRACYQQHSADDPELPADATIEFYIHVVEDGQRRRGAVSEVQVGKSKQDRQLDGHEAFEACVLRVLADIEFVPPGGTGVARIPIAVRLTDAE